MTHRPLALAPLALLACASQAAAQPPADSTADSEAESASPAPAPAPADPNPLAMADQGYWKCTSPDPSTRTCRSLTQYQADPAGGWSTRTEALFINADITFETQGHVIQRGDRICGTSSKQGLEQAIIRFRGHIVQGERAKSIIADLTNSLGWTFGREGCTRYVTGQFGTTATSEVEGLPNPPPGVRVRWVLPSEGYHVAHASQRDNPWLIAPPGWEKR